MNNTRQKPYITILVEGETDKAVVAHLLMALGIDTNGRAKIIVCDGKKGVKHELHRLRSIDGVIALIDADKSSVADSIGWARHYLETSSEAVFCAVPTIEAWLFADKELALKNAKQTEYAKSAIGRIVTPESLINPKYLVHQVFDRNVIHSNFPFMQDVNIGRAVAASASLFHFLHGVETLLGHSWTYAEQHLSISINRTVFSNLLREIPADRIGWRTLDGEYTAAQLGDLVLQGNEIGLRYLSELLRLSRDILAARTIDKQGEEWNG